MSRRKEKIMQYILSKKGKEIPFYNIRKVIGSNNLPVSIIVSFRKSELESKGINIEELLHDPEETIELKTHNGEGMLLNTYYGYNKLDEMNHKYDYIVSPYIPAIEAIEEQVDEEGNIIVPAAAATEEVPEVKDTLITATLLKRNEYELKLDDTSKTVDAMAVAMAEMMGGM